jgi:cytochrome c peroxidase
MRWYQRHPHLWACVALALVFVIATALASQIRMLAPITIEPAGQFKIPDLLAASEPITPIPSPPEIDPLKLALGERLFATPLLSRDNRRSCLSCHDVQTNGADANRHDKSIDGAENFFNSSTVFNAALSYRFNWEGNARSLESQAAVALESPHYLDQRIDDSLAKLQADPAFLRQFNTAYGKPPDRDSLLDAIASYERSLLTPGDRFDRWLKGDKTALSDDELEGYGLFKSLGCVSCHQGVNIGGNLMERHGIFRPLASPNPALLRVPSLRNVATTAPYFHDGSSPSLEDAVRKMGAAQLNRELTDQQVSSIVAFLGTLTGTYAGHPVTEPKP